MRIPFTWMATLALAATGPGALRAQWSGTVAPEPVASSTFPSEELPAPPVLQSSLWSIQPTMPDLDYGPPVPLSPHVPVSISPPEPATRFLRENQPDLVEELYEQVLELEPNADTRRAIERVREVDAETEGGTDTSDEEWIESKWVQNKKNLTLNWGGRIHSDWTTFANDSDFGGQSDYIEFRRLRLMAAGEGYGIYFYQLELEFSPDLTLAPQAGVTGVPNAGIELKDAYLGMRDVAGFGTVRIGHYFTGMGMDSQTSSNHLTFMERSLVGRFLPGREFGIEAASNTVDERLIWSYGLFAYEMREASRVIEDDNQGYRLIGRVAGTPYYDEPSEGRYLLHTGIGYCYSRPRMTDLLAGTNVRAVEFDARPEVHRGDTLVSTGALDANYFHQVATELAWVNGPLFIQNEFVWTGVEEATQGPMSFYGTNVDVGYFLTGESRAYNRRQGKFDQIIPIENAWFVRTPGNSSVGWGAWQIAGRWSYMDLSETGDQRLQDVTLGVNWYLNPHSRLMFNWVHAIADNSFRITVAEKAQGDILSMRFQVDF